MEAAVTTALETFERGGAIEVPVARIETELTNLWRQAVQKSSRPGAVSRACLWNLIVRVDTEPLFVQAKQLVDELSVWVPARVIVLHAQAEAPDAPLRAWVEANWRNQGGSQSGSDEVTLFAAGRTIERLPSLVRSLVVPDAPTAMLWWGPPPTERSRGLIREIDRLIVDSRKLPSEKCLADFDRIVEEQRDVELVDCAWLGVRPLRGLCAGLFDPPNDPRRLEVLDRVRVVSGVSGCQSRALLTLGWLASRLGWSGYRVAPPATNVRRWRAARKDGGELTLELETRLDGPSHGVTGLELQTGDDRWTLSREAGRVECRGVHCNERFQPMRSHTDAELVVTALGPRGRRDPIFEEALGATAALVGAS
jgi:glucose-6-phosphate dehydrogenase assembly protein OpcA